MILSILFRFIPIPRIEYTFTASLPHFIRVYIQLNPSVAWKMNHMCCLFSALAATFLGLIVYRFCIYESKVLLTSQPTVPLSIASNEVSNNKSHKKKSNKSTTNTNTSNNNVECNDNTVTTNAKTSNTTTPTLNYPPQDVHYISVTAASCAVLLYGCNTLVWEYSVGSEVFALNNMLCVICVYCVVFIHTTALEIHHEILTPGSVNNNSTINTKVNTMLGYIYLGAVTSGMCLANQHTSLLLVLVLVLHMGYWILSDKLPLHIPGHGINSSHHKYTVFGVCIVLFISSMLFPYTYLYLASSHPTPGSWGDLTTITGYVYIHLARLYIFIFIIIYTYCIHLYIHLYIG